jgi:hypothetical protein
MKLFISLPDALIIDLFSVWLYTKDMATLDSAVCSNEFRETMLEFLASDILRFRGEISLEVFGNWAVLRNLKLRKVLFTEKSLVCYDLGEFDHLNCSKVSQLILNGISIENQGKFADFVNKCKSLVELKVLISRDDVILHIDPNILKQMTTLSSVSFANLDHIISCCSNLTDCCVFSNGRIPIVGGEKILSFAKSNRNLKRLKICGVIIKAIEYRQLRSILSANFIQFPFGEIFWN